MSDNESNKDNKSENETQKNYHTKTEISINSNIILLNHTPSSHNNELREEEREIQKIIENNLKIENERKLIKEKELYELEQIQKNSQYEKKSEKNDDIQEKNKENKTQKEKDKISKNSKSSKNSKNSIDSNSKNSKDSKEKKEIKTKKGEKIIKLKKNKKKENSNKNIPQLKSQKSSDKIIKIKNEVKIEKNENTDKNNENPNNNQEKTKISIKPSTISETLTKEFEIKHKDSKWKKKVTKFLDSTPILITMSILTIWALFASDIEYAFLSKKVDYAFNVIQIIIFCIFTLEFILTCITKNYYIFSFFFYLDLISTISLIQDIDYIMNPFMGYSPVQEDKISRNGRRKSAQAAKAISKVSTASRATRVLRVIRIVRLIRMVKLYKSVLIAKEKREMIKLENKRKIMEKLEKDFDDSSSSRIEHLDRINSFSTSINNNNNFNNLNSKSKLNNQDNNNNFNGNLINKSNSVSNSNTKGGMGSTIMRIRNLKRLKEKKSSIISKSGDSTGGLLLHSTGFLRNAIPLENNILRSSSNKDNNITNHLNFNIMRRESNNIQIYNNKNIENKDKVKDIEKDKDKDKENEKDKDNNDNDDEDNYDNILKESKISHIVTESLTKKVIILILILLVIFPLLNESFWDLEVNETYYLVSEILSLHYSMFQKRGITDNQINITKLYDNKYPVINITINGVSFYINENLNKFDYRYKEISTVYSNDAMVRIIYSLRRETRLNHFLNLCQTIFVCVALTISTLLFENDANELVLKPLEIMIEIVDKVAKDPIGAKNVEELQDGVKQELLQIEKNDKNNKISNFPNLKNINSNIHENEHIISNISITNNIHFNLSNNNLNNNKNNNNNKINNNNKTNNNNKNEINTNHENNDKLMNSNINKTLIFEKTEDENYEVSVIKSAIIKISALLAIGFGEAGGEIIKKNLSNNQDLNPRIKGKKKKAIFSFCDIRQFEEINLALEEKTILFINRIAEIVHSSVDRYKGSTNKNIGESFLNVWKFYNEIHINKGKKNEKIIKKDNLLEIDPTNPQVGIIADCSVLACLRIILKINKNLDILKYNQNEKILKKIPNFKVNMGFGLHMGYGIEGAIGSIYKIDASYLSPNVNIAARLETLTRQFKINILISGALYNLFTDDMKNICRFIDKVTVKGSHIPLDLYTIDLNLNVSKQRNSKILIMNSKEKSQLFNEKKMELDALIEEYGSVTSIILEKNSYRELMKERNSDFKTFWNSGIKYYISGDWKSAKLYFDYCLNIDPEDGPANVLSKFINDFNLKPPQNWKGVRELSSK